MLAATLSRLHQSKRLRQPQILNKTLNFLPSTIRSCSTANMSRGQMVWVDCEMTGLNPESDTILEIAVLITDSELNVVAEGPNNIIHHPDHVLEKMNAWCKEHHGRSGLTKAVRESKISLTDCENEVLKFLQTYTKKGCCPLAGNSVGQDAKFLEKYMPKVMEHLHYRIIDVSTIKELTFRWYPTIYQNRPVKALSHRAMDDIKESVAELKFYKDNVFISKP